ncbi:cell-envelope stress modulator CpxP [Shigella flexneri]
MMRIVTAAVMASTLAVSSLSHAAEVGSGDNWHPGEELTQRSTQSHMFDGISLTEHQRQQMRDLCNRPGTNSLLLMLANWRAMHRLVTAENFDENAVRAQAEKWRMSKLLVRLMAKVRNQMYRLLTPEQQAVLNEKHQQRMEQLRDVTQWQKSSSLKLLSSSNSRSQ